ncbi:MAG TPA: metallophosphoesterase [Dysgonomonas sp.]|uniref:metallophosphoesterase n=1 Tax=unclassified Dysgonomonas TaxID=2630389 RepID=UPI0025BFF2E0|nr:MULTISPECIES: metallophosphoesterase [unclassified Dysgonomonas]HML64346.1 metallophosphoesterase [Dysgonomonas sp.]
MKILHLSDLHFIDNEKCHAKINEIKNRIVENNKGKDIEYLFFTGDLVQTGNNIEDFNKALSVFVYDIAYKLNIDKQNIIICAGNHDVHRDQEMQLVTEAIDKIRTNDDLDKFIIDKSQFELSLKNIQNYIDVQASHYQDNTIIHPLYTITKINDRGQIINIVTINSSWRCRDDEDSGRLLFPNIFLSDIKNKIEEDDSFSIILLHHPTSDFNYYNRVLIDEFILNHFSVKFSGHIHKNKIQKSYITDRGIVDFFSESCNCDISKNENVGYFLLDINFENAKINFNSFRIDSDYIHYPVSSEVVNIPIGKEKREKIEFTLLLNQIFENENSQLRNLFISESNNNTFLDLFETPLLKNTPTMSLKGLSKQQDTSKIITVDSLLNEKVNFAIYGKDKYGKTILLHYIYLSLLKDFSYYQKIPLIINAEFWKSRQKIDDLFITKYNLSRAFLEKYKNNYSLVILVDNIYKDPTETLLAEIQNFLKETPNCSVIYSINEMLISQQMDNDLDKISKPIYIHSLTAKEIRTLTNNLDCDIEIKGQILKNIKTVFKQLNLPVNYWTVSLFIWVYKNSNNKHFESNFELIELYIDNLLDKEDIVTNRIFKINYESLKEFLGELAIYLVTAYREAVYSISYDELVLFMHEYKEKNRRFVIETELLAKLLIDKGIIIKNIQGRYGFRLKGIFEYFIAYHLKDAARLRDDIINNDTIYLSFGNELELIAGFNKKDKDFINKIYDKTNDFFYEATQKYIDSTKDDILNAKSKELQQKMNELKMFSVVSSEVNSLAMSDTDNSYQVSQKKIYESIERNSQNLEKFLFILSRVFRNSNINESSLNDKVLDFILDSTCNLSFLILEEGLKEKNPSEYLSLLSTFTPFVAQGFLSEALSQSNLETLFLDKIEQLKKYPGNDFKLYILYTLVIDLDLKSNKKYIPDLIKHTSSNIIKFAIISKLLSHLMFGVYLSEDTKDYIENQILSVGTDLKYSIKDMENLKKSINNIRQVNRTKDIYDNPKKYLN